MELIGSFLTALFAVADQVTCEDGAIAIKERCDECISVLHMLA